MMMATKKFLPLETVEGFDMKPFRLDTLGKFTMITSHPKNYCSFYLTLYYTYQGIES